MKSAKFAVTDRGIAAPVSYLIHHSVDDVRYQFMVAFGKTRGYRQSDAGRLQELSTPSTSHPEGTL